MAGTAARSSRQLHCHILESIHLLIGVNPAQVVIDAVSKTDPREDSNCIDTGGVAQRRAIDAAPYTV